MGNLSLNQERKDARINRILNILVSFLSWFRTKSPLLVQNKKTRIAAVSIPEIG